MSNADVRTVFAAHKEDFSSAVLAGVMDNLGRRNSALPAYIRPLNPEWKVFGRAKTLSVVPVAEEPAEPFAMELACIDSLEPGDVLVATTHGDHGSALWGELLSTAAHAHGAVGAVLDGMTRDGAKILNLDFPVFAAGLCPLDSKGRLDGINHGKPIRIGECIVRPGDWLFGDGDGVVVVPGELAEQVTKLALEKISGENRVRAELASGRSVREVFAKYRIL